MIGDENTQPTESVESIDQLAQMMGSEEEGETLIESEDGEDSDGIEPVDGEEEEGEAEETETAKQRFTIKHDGKDVELELSPDETVDMLQKSFDYTQKTMAVAEERKAVEAERTKASEFRQQSEQALQVQIDRLQAVEQFMEAQIGDPPPIEWAQQDAAFYLAQKQLHEDRKGQLAQASKAVEDLRIEQQRQRQASLAERIESTEKALRDTLPGWNDDVMKEHVTYAIGLGIKPQEVGEAFLQPGLWQLIHKAKAYDALLAKKAEMKPVNQLPKVAKPGNGNQPPQLAKRHEAIRKHKASPSIGSLADLAF